MALLIDVARNSSIRRVAPRAFRTSTWNLIGGAALLLLGVLCIVTSAVAVDESPQVLEQRVKAAFLFKFGGYVEWPDSAFPSKDTPLVIGVAGADVLAEELSQVVAGRTMNGRPVSVRRVRGGEPLSSVHVLFVGRPEMGRLTDLAAQARPILTVTDTEKGLALGSIINFVVADNRVRFEVSLDAAKRSGLRIGAPLLSVAMRVQE
ncbi:MAG: YfiR family protein [Betaproteobacteria bacterium]|nr:YfiR family protein [Betaproteobacteria bacterium]